MKLVAEATNGQEAIEKFGLHQPDVTLMDLQMPVLNGIEAIIAIRSEFPTPESLSGRRMPAMPRCCALLR
ncbi:MAG: two component transcriptional regulator, LuxR family, partial [Bryobacterales bacterium]|nr:two component transcriptional regulator, LuxR family [Bryobacterales bacterium]